MMYTVRLFVTEDPTFSADKCIYILDRGGRDEKMELLTFGTFYVLVK